MICDAIVTARDGGDVETLDAYDEALASGSTACYYGGANSRPGTYSIEVVWGSRRKVVDGIQVAVDECTGAKKRSVRVTLDP